MKIQGGAKVKRDQVETPEINMYDVSYVDEASALD